MTENIPISPSGLNGDITFFSQIWIIFAAAFGHYFVKLDE